MLTDSKTREDRLNVCKSCESLVAGVKCTKCGCFVNVKVVFLSMKCPDNKWNK